MSYFHPADLIFLRDQGWLVAIKIQSGSIDVTGLFPELIQDHRAFIFVLLWIVKFSRYWARTVHPMEYAHNCVLRCFNIPR